MGFSEDLARHAEQIVTRTPHIRGEEATKHALVVPLIQLLGYDVFDPREVQPEYTADFATKTRGQLEKIDYAIWKDGKAAIFVECKATTAELADHDGQLGRYFNATPSVRVGVLTNGIRLKAFTDLSMRTQFRGRGGTRWASLARRPGRLGEASVAARAIHRSPRNLVRAVAKNRDGAMDRRGARTGVTPIGGCEPRPGDACALGAPTCLGDLP